MNKLTWSDLSQDEQDFVTVIATLLRRKQNDLGKPYVPIENIHLGVQTAEDKDIYDTSIPTLQKIAERQKKSDEDWKITARRMFEKFCKKSLLEKICFPSERYKLIKNGFLHMYLTKS